MSDVNTHGCDVEPGECINRLVGRSYLFSVAEYLYNRLQGLQNFTLPHHA